ncbi:hypothetical protein [Streptosporangium sp. NPDC049376]|uniref:hypothetical protein n=1 Tax=Streptosporangium sp. NPDC049376 TaxID=3366192 RepID=UPI00379C8A6D
MSPTAKALLSVPLAVAINKIFDDGMFSLQWTIIAVVLTILIAEPTPTNLLGPLSTKSPISRLFILITESSINVKTCLLLLTVLAIALPWPPIPIDPPSEPGNRASSTPPPPLKSPTGSPTVHPTGNPTGSPTVSPPGKPPGGLPSPLAADPCRLVDAVRLGRFGKTEIDPAYGNFDRCDVLIYPPGEDEVDVKVEFDPGPLPEQTTSSETMKNVIVMKEPAQSTECERRMALSADNDTIVSVTAKRGEKGRASLCDIADTATEIAAEKLGAGELEKYPRSLPQDSLANEDACALLSPDTLGEFVPGVDAANPYVGYGNWTCKWSSTTGDLRVNLHFDQGRQPDSTDGAPTRLNGYRAFVERWADDERACLTQVVHRSYPDRYGRTKAETLQLLVDGSFPMDRLCRVSTELAYSATAQLRGAA